MARPGVVKRLVRGAMVICCLLCADFGVVILTVTRAGPFWRFGLAHPTATVILVLLANAAFLILLPTVDRLMLGPRADQ